MAALITKAIERRHPRVELTVLSQSSVEILRNLEDFSIDVGLTHLDNEPIEVMRAETIYRERYSLLVRDDHDLARRTSVTWAEAGQQSLCLLTADMQNRRIVDRAFRAAGSGPVPRAEPLVEHAVGWWPWIATPTPPSPGYHPLCLGYA